jgi:hypothetical protein
VVLTFLCVLQKMRPLQKSTDFQRGPSMSRNNRKAREEAQAAVQQRLTERCRFLLAGSQIKQAESHGQGPQQPNIAQALQYRRLSSLQQDRTVVFIITVVVCMYVPLGFAEPPAFIGITSNIMAWGIQFVMLRGRQGWKWVRHLELSDSVLHKSVLQKSLGGRLTRVRPGRGLWQLVKCERVGPWSCRQRPWQQ